VSAKAADSLLQHGREVPFADIEATLARLARDGRRRHAAARALTATVVVIGPAARLAAAAEALEQLREAAGVRAILISEGTRTTPIVRVSEQAVAITELAPGFLNNAVAALRLSSLPTLVWWRGGSLDDLDELAALADRLVLDAEDADAAWARAPRLIHVTALTDLRWTRLTRWRSALAHLFDLPQVLRGAAGLRSLAIDAHDLPSARLFAGWLRGSLRWPSSLPIVIRAAKGDASIPLERVHLDGTSVSISIQVMANRQCLEASVDGVDASARVVPLGEGTLASLVGEELGVRTRDLAFEQALSCAREISA
jgi:glucose-6-phosphate dehydrogenase assembly protein OpcA